MRNSENTFHIVLLKRSIKKFNIPNIPNLRELLTSGVTLSLTGKRCFIENKNKIGTLRALKPSKNENILYERHQNFTGSYNVLHFDRRSFAVLWKQ